jgi:hypothetical protein
MTKNEAVLVNQIYLIFKSSTFLVDSSDLKIKVLSCNLLNYQEN